MQMDQQETAETFLRRKAKNLEFFKRRYPAMYKHYSNLLMKRVELVVSPVEVDVDLHVDGASLYGGRAKATALHEVNSFLADNEPDTLLKTFQPPHHSGYKYPRFASRSAFHCLKSLPDRSEGFVGYPMGNFYPFLVFLGCGLGYHIEAMVERVDIVNALVFEPDDEKFAASLFTVDWENICQRFLGRKGYDLRFAVGVDASDKNLKDLLERNLNKRVPLHPAMTLYFNHQADKSNRAIADRIRQDLPTLFSNWGNYDDEMRRLNNTAFNLRSAPRFLKNENRGTFHKPVVIVGSGPSIDERLPLLKENRHKITLVSAGTGLKPLISNGVKPDFHVELDPDYFIYQLLSEIGSEKLKGITLLAVNEINPLVTDLFDDAYLYAKTDNPAPKALQLHKYAFEHCNPTCTNAAFAIFQQLGFRNFFLFGTDYGFRDRTQHHASGSVYGNRDENSTVSVRLNDLAKKNFLEGKLIEVDSVDGGKVLTRSDYYTAMRSVEELLYWAEEKDKQLQVWNCADGAKIAGTTWLSGEQFHDELDRIISVTAEEPAPREVVGGLVCEHSDPEIEERLQKVGEFVSARCNQARHILAASLRGKKDVVRLMAPLIDASQMVETLKGFNAPQPEQYLAQHLLRGSLMNFIMIGLYHSMACGGDKEAKSVAAIWQKSFSGFLGTLPGHYGNVITDISSGEGERWLHWSIHDSETVISEQ
jgi:hypothetical protein